jgi:predicted DNA-binding WGR domain protein
MNTVELHRIDDAQNMRRFYRLDMQPDLFGGVMRLTLEETRPQ